MDEKPLDNRNGESTKLNDKRNEPMTNAERQKRYRDKKRGGPPQGRWAGHIPAGPFAKAAGTSRTFLFYARWVQQYAPDVADDIYDGKLKLASNYERLRREYEMGLMGALKSRPSDTACLVSRRENGEFVFEWRENE